MKAFKFSLQVVLDQTINARDLLRAKLHRAQQVLDHLRDERARMERTRQEVTDTYLDNLHRGMRADDVQSHAAFIDEFSLRINAQDARIQRAEEERQRLLQESIENHKKIKTLENIREKQYEAHLQALKKAEEKSVEDMLGYQAASN